MVSMTIMDRVRQERVIAIVRGQPLDALLHLAQAFKDGGIGMMELPFAQDAPETWKDTAAAISAVKKEFGDDVAVGTGTVLTLEQFKIAADAGAQYIVSPTTDVEIIRTGKKQGLCMFPGALTPTEILTAYNAGADAVKVFPVGCLGAGYIKAISAPLSHIPLMGNGGVNEKNAADFIKAGCCGVGVGGNLVNKEWIAAGEWDKITALAKEFEKAVHSV